MQVEPQQPTRLAPAGAVTLLAVACLTIMVGCAIVPALPSIAPALGVPRASSWLVTLPSLGVVLFAPIAGRVIDWIGGYRSLCAGLLLYGILGLSALMLYGPGTVFADRILLGGATALVMSAGTTLISDFYSGAQRMAMIARQGMAIEFGGVIFLVIGGLLAKLGWAGPFALYAMAFVFLAMVVAFIPEPAHDREALTDNSQGASEQSGGLGIVYTAAILSMTFFFTAIIVLPFRLAAFKSHPFSESEVGYYLAIISLVAVGAASIMPRVIGHLGQLGTLSVSFASYAIAHACFLFATNIAVLIFGVIFMGCGFGLSVPLVNHMTVERSSPAKRGQSFAYLSVALFLGQFLSSAIEFVPGGFGPVFSVASMGAAAIAIMFGIGFRGEDRKVPKPH